MDGNDCEPSLFSQLMDGKGSKHFSPFRFAMLFGTAAIGLALVVPSMYRAVSHEDIFPGYDPGIDYTTTATIRAGRKYTVRRSVLQRAPGDVCIIEANGRRSSGC